MNKVVIVTATWCGPCKAYKPIIEEAKAEIEAKGYSVEFLDADENSEFCQKHDIRGVPSTLIINEMVTKLSGKRSKEEILGHLF